MSTEEIIRQAKSLSREEQAVIVDSLLVSLHEPDPDVDAAWVTLALSRLEEYRRGNVESIPFDLVREELRERRRRK